jgi:hypothetical protein
MLHSLTARYTLRQFAPHLNPGYASHMSAKIVKDTSMTYDNLMTTILRAGRKDWLFHEPLKTYTFKPDLDIQIRMRPDSPNRQSFVEDWTKVLTQPQANLKTFDIYYRSSIIESFNLASVRPRPTSPCPNRAPTRSRDAITNWPRRWTRRIRWMPTSNAPG